MAAFALGGLLIPAGLSVLTYFWARTYLVDQRQSSAVHQASANAQLVQTLLSSPQPDVSGMLTSIQTPSSAQSVVLHAGRWFGTSAVAGPDALPAGLRQMVLGQGRPARQRYHSGGVQVLAVGVPPRRRRRLLRDLLPQRPDHHPADLARRPGRRQPAGLRPQPGHRGLGHRPGAAPGARHRPGGGSHSRRAGSTPVSTPRETRSWQSWPAGSTPWSTAWPSVSSATPASPLTSATSCARPSPRCAPR